MSFIDTIGEAIKNMVTDAAELEVNTFTGDLKAIFSAPAQGKKVSFLDWSKIKQKAKAEGTVQLAASSQMKIDGDQNQFFASNITPELLEAHHAAVESGLLVRQGFVRLVKDVF
ncbi:MAG: hypothetical protein GY841_07500 [FCB group bacterium]|nr:hypothetical protein [FCB group bacterium]